MVFKWFQRLLISLIFGYVISQIGTKYVNVTENMLFFVAGGICFGIGFVREKWARKFFFILTMIAVLIPIGKIFRDGFQWSDTKSYITAFVIFVPIMFIPTKWNRNVLNRVIISSGIAIEICIYLTKWVDYLPVEMFVAWMPVIYVIFQPHLLTFLFFFVLNYLTGQWLLDNLEIRWLIPATAGVVLFLSTILNLVIKPKPPKRRSSWSYSGGGGSSNNDFWEEPDQATNNKYVRPNGYDDADYRAQEAWKDGRLKDQDDFDRYRNQVEPNFEHLDN